jgi:hypothetical protein
MGRSAKRSFPGIVVSGTVPREMESIRLIPEELPPWATGYTTCCDFRLGPTIVVENRFAKNSRLASIHGDFHFTDLSSALERVDEINADRFKWGLFTGTFGRSAYVLGTIQVEGRRIPLTLPEHVLPRGPIKDFDNYWSALAYARMNRYTPTHQFFDAA